MILLRRQWLWLIPPLIEIARSPPRIVKGFAFRDCQIQKAFRSQQESSGFFRKIGVKRSIGGLALDFDEYLY
jgi:hypothetical protein